MALLPTNAAGFYQLVKWMVVTWVIGSTLGVIILLASMDTSRATAPGFMLQRLADLFILVSFLCWIFILCTTCSAVGNEAWFQPMKRTAIIGSILVIIVSILSFVGSLLELQAMGDGDESGDEANKALRILRFTRILPALVGIAAAILFGKARDASRCAPAPSV